MFVEKSILLIGMLIIEKLLIYNVMIGALIILLRGGQELWFMVLSESVKLLPALGQHKY